REGHPELPVKGVLIQVPDRLGEGTRLEVVEGEFRTVGNRMILPAPALRLSKGGKPVASFSKDPVVYSTPGFFPDKAAELIPAGTLRGVPVARVLFHPFQWNPLTGELRHARRIVVKVSFDSSSPPAFESTETGSNLEDPFGTLLQKSVLNYRGAGSPAELKRAVTPWQLPARSVRIEVNRDGIYRIGYADLVRAGAPMELITPRTLQLFNGGEEVAIQVVTKVKGVWGAGDYIQFHGRQRRSRFSDTNVYWLRWGKTAGRRVAQVSANTVGSPTTLDAARAELHFEEDHTDWSLRAGAPETDFLFWKKLTAPSIRPDDATVACSLAIPFPVQDGDAVDVTFCLVGRSTAPPSPNHHALASLNGFAIADLRWDGEMELIQTVQAPSSLLAQGSNTLTIRAPGDSGTTIDVFYLNWIKVAYQRRLQAVEDRLDFSIESESLVDVRVSGFSGRSITVFDVTDPLSVKVLRGLAIVSTDGGRTYTASFSHAGGTRQYFAVAKSGIRALDRVSFTVSKGLKSATKAADYILVTDRAFLGAVKPLLDLRRSQNLRVRAVATEDIYNEFSYGLFDPQALKDFLQFAFTSWQRPAPSYVFLLGDSDMDYKDAYGSGKKNLVPVHLSRTSGLGVTPDDDWFVAFDSTGELPQMMLGRASAASTEVAARVAGKIVNYEKSILPPPKQTLFAADNDLPTFTDECEELIGLLPTGYEAARVYLSAYANPLLAKADIASRLNQGSFVTTYVGYGTFNQWASENLFSIADVPNLTSGAPLTFALMLGSLGGYSSLPGNYGLADTLVITPDRGAIAAFAPAGLSIETEQQILGRSILSSMFTMGTRPLGAISTKAKLDAFASGMPSDVVRMYTLFGDPACLLK
ncbi:MAG: C25 family cysteine peptidase, partial [Acidobacteriota bacterium]